MPVARHLGVKGNKTIMACANCFPGEYDALSKGMGLQTGLSRDRWYRSCVLLVSAPLSMPDRWCTLGWLCVQGKRDGCHAAGGMTQWPVVMA